LNEYTLKHLEKKTKKHSVSSDAIYPLNVLCIQECRTWEHHK